MPAAANCEKPRQRLASWPKCHFDRAVPVWDMILLGLGIYPSHGRKTSDSFLMAGGRPILTLLWLVLVSTPCALRSPFLWVVD